MALTSFNHHNIYHSLSVLGQPVVFAYGVVSSPRMNDSVWNSEGDQSLVTLFDFGTSVSKLGRLTKGIDIGQSEYGNSILHFC